MGMLCIEGVMFAMLIVTYFYLRGRVNEWPPGLLPPTLRWSTANTAVFLLSAIPNEVIRRNAKKGNLKIVRWGWYL